jgi:Alkaline phosphatase PhoX
MKRTLIGALIVCGAVTAAAFAAGSTETGPSSSQSPYVLPSQDGVVTKSILTVGDSVGGYRMVGIPDGLGAAKDRHGNFTVFMNHELANNLGAVRAHGSTGAFVSQWSIRKQSLAVNSGRDLIQQVATWNAATSTFNPAAKGVSLGRFCSATLAPRSAIYDKKSKLGYRGRLFMDGEEVGTEGRAFAHAEDGTSYELASVGKYSFENAVANPATGKATVVVGTDDSTPGQVYVYVGQKTATGNPAEKAGLTGGTLYGLKVDGVATETDGTVLPGGSARFSLVPLGDVTNLTGAQLQAATVAAGASNMNRPEDGSWDPSNARNFYFNTTAAFNGISRIWKLRFDSPADVLAGGVATIAVASPPFDPAKANEDQSGPRMLDNMTVNTRGQVISLEDVGNNAYLGGVYQYDPSTGLARIAEHDPARFAVGGSAFITQDEESSGVIPAPFLGSGKYLIDVQNHRASADPELVEGGQLLVLQIPPGKPVG